MKVKGNLGPKIFEAFIEGDCTKEARRLKAERPGSQYTTQEDVNGCWSLHEILNARPDVSASPVRASEPAYSNGALVTACSDIIEEKLIALYPGLLWVGKHTSFAGDPGLGKSVVSLDIAARLSRGGVVSPYSADKFEPCNVLIASGEDASADTVVPRLRVAGADLKRVKILSGVVCEGLAQHIDLGRHLRELEAAIKEHAAKLLVIDPVSSFLGKIDGNSQTDVRGAIDPVNKMLERTGCAMLSVAHLNKSNSLRAIYRVGGSIALVGAPRAVFGFVRDETAGDPKTARLLLPVKVNLVREPEGYGLALTDSGGYPKIQWNAERSLARIDDALNPPQVPASDRAADALREILADGAEHASEDIFAALKGKVGRNSIYKALGNVAIKRNATEGAVFYRLRQVTQIDGAIWDEK